MVSPENKTKKGGLKLCVTLVGKTVMKLDKNDLKKPRSTFPEMFDNFIILSLAGSAIYFYPQWAILIIGCAFLILAQPEKQT